MTKRERVETEIAETKLAILRGKLARMTEKTPAQEYAERPAMLCPANADPATVQYFSDQGYRMIPIGRIG